MVRKSILALAALAISVPAFAHTTQIPSSQFAASQPQPVLRLMNDREFSAFLVRLDSDLVRSEQQLKKMDVKSLSLDAQDKRDLERSYSQCLQSLDDTRDEIQKLSQKQTLKLDLYLLIDLNDLARTLDAMDEVLLNPATVGGTSGAQKSLGYAREVLNIDGTLAAETSTFQHHFIAFTGVVDATLDQSEPDPSQPESQK